DRRSGPAVRRGGVDPDAGSQPRSRQDDRHGHARSEGRRVCAPDAASGQGHPGRQPCAVGGVKYLHLIWAALLRRKARTVFTILSVLTAFLLFGLLDTVRTAFNNVGGNVSG